MPVRWDAVIVGSGPNGLTAAAQLAQAGHSVLVLEAAGEIGGGARTLPLTLPGFRHDVCSAIHPLTVSSPAFRTMPLAQHGLRWVHPAAPLAHPLDGGRAVLLHRSLTATAIALGPDAAAWHRLLAPAVHNWDMVISGKPSFPNEPLGVLRMAVAGARSAAAMWHAKFRGPAAQALIAGMAAHSNLPPDQPLTAGFALALAASAHAVGWPFPRGGAGQISDALSRYLQSMGVAFETGVRVHSLDHLPPHRMALCDVSPRELLRLGGARFPLWYHRELERYRYGPGAFKVDWALDAPVPWAAAECARAGTLHLGGTAGEIAATERAVGRGECPEYPAMIAAQHTLFDPSRAPLGMHTFWAYCHVPNASTVDMTERMERQIERFAPGFRNRILGRSVMGPAALQSHNSNLIGGDVYGGSNRWQQMLSRPSLMAYRTPDERVLLCSASTPPGAGVHGMCGYFAARIALRRLRRL